MKKLKGSFPAKTIAVVLFCILCLGCVFNAAAAGMLYTAGFYDRGAAAARENLAQSLCALEAQNIANRVLPVDGEGENDTLLASSANFRYEVRDCDGVLRANTYNGEESIAVVTIPVSEWYP